MPNAAKAEDAMEERMRKGVANRMIEDCKGKRYSDMSCTRGLLSSQRPPIQPFIVRKFGVSVISWDGWSADYAFDD